MNINQKLTLITVVLVASVIATPIVYAIVEPHILINMDSGQTTKPFQIKDNFGQEVFSVDVDGTIFPEPIASELSPTLTTLSDRYFIIDFTQFPEISQVDAVADGVQDFDSYLALATWEITFNSTTVHTGDYVNPISHVGLLHGFMQKVGTNQVGGSGTINQVLFQASFDQVDWTSVQAPNGILQSSSTSFVAIQANTFGTANLCKDRPNPDDTCYIRLGWGDRYHNGNELRIKELQAYAEIVLPVGATMVRTS